MSGLQTLAREGLSLLAADPPEPFAERLHWRRVAEGEFPDADTTVLLWVLHDDGADWCAGWFDGEQWLDAASGGQVGGTVTFWAEPRGPQA